jgi:hypothetical protein
VSVACAPNRDSKPPDDVDKNTTCPYKKNPEVTTSEDVFDTKETCPVDAVGGTASLCWLQLAFEDSVVLGLAMNVLEDTVTREPEVRTAIPINLFLHVRLTIGGLKRGVERRLLPDIGKTCQNN